MAQPANAQSTMFFTAAERSQRSVFVGNIPYEATEDELKVVFSQVGPVVNFRLVFDRESGKPKGYGFCEYLDPDTAMSAMRNLNNVEFHGRVLRVDTATGDRNKEEIRQLQMTFGGPQEESPYGPPVEAEKAPEAISRAVASLPPEQMFELMKQMKLCIQNNPNEARNMLLQNPQLAYALLQAQVVMRIVDPQMAIAMLHRESIGGNQLTPLAGPTPMPQTFMPPPSTSAMPMMPPLGGMPMGLGMNPAGVRLPQMNVGMGPPTMQLPPILGPLVTGGDVDYRQGVRAPPPTIPPPSMPPKVIPPKMNVASTPSNEDQEKAQLIMQVIQLTDEQIAMLPPDQRQSVMILKEQLKNKS